jgi:hypothetical protein
MQWLGPQASIGCCGLSFFITELIFSGKMPLGTPQKRVTSKKSFHLSSKKSGARVTAIAHAESINRLCHSCCGLSISITGLIFSGKMPLGTPKKRVTSQKSFHLSSKKSGARLTCNGSGRKHQSAAAG